VEAVTDYEGRTVPAESGERKNEAHWTPLMDAVHRLIEEAGAECPEHDDEPLCMSIAVGLWLEGWRPAPQPPPPAEVWPAGDTAAVLLAPEGGTGHG
jgi:hypothetical protein